MNLGRQRIVDLSAMDEQLDVSDIAGARVLYGTDHEEPLSVQRFTESEQKTLEDDDTLTIKLNGKGDFAV